MKNEELDKKIGMPDVDAEWNRFEREVIAPSFQNSRGLSLGKIAAILLTAVLLSGLGYAAVRTSFFTRRWNEPKKQVVAEQATQTEPTTRTIPRPEIKAVGDTVVLFKDVRLDSIMLLIDQHYGVQSRFLDEESRSIRLLFKWNKQQALDEVLEPMNGFERFQIRRTEENTLVVEQKTED